MNNLLSLQDALEIPAAVLFRHIDDETVLLNMESGFYFGLNPIGARIFQLIAQHGTLERVFEVALEEYAVSPAQLRHDLLALASELRDKGLLHVRPAPHSAP